MERGCDFRHTFSVIQRVRSRRFMSEVLKFHHISLMRQIPHIWIFEYLNICTLADLQIVWQSCARVAQSGK
jgi:hypothetical protein